MSEESGKILLSWNCCITDVRKELFKATKKGDKWITLNSFISAETEQHTFENGDVKTKNGSIEVPKSQEERDAKKKTEYVKGDVKILWQNELPFKWDGGASKTDVNKIEVVAETNDDLPF